jgi:hypothetical protein
MRKVIVVLLIFITQYFERSIAKDAAEFDSFVAQTLLRYRTDAATV